MSVARIAAAQDHDPSDAAVPWTGAPAPIEGRTAGGALSPYGSHVGVKALLDPAPEVAPAALAAIAVHDGRAAQVGRRATLSLVVEAGGTPLPPADTAVRFDPWGWTTTCSVGTLQVQARTFFVAEDALIATVRLQPTGAGDTDVTVRLDASANGAVRRDGGDVLLSADDTVLALGAADGVTVRAGGPPAVLVVGAATLTAGEPTSFTVMIGFGANDDEARHARDGGWAAFASRDAEAAWAQQQQRFEQVEASAACSEEAGDAATDAHHLAVAALWSSAYAPRGALTHTMLSAAKSLDNGFVGSDLPAQARAVASWDPALGLGALFGQLDALADDSHVPYRFDDELVRDPLPNGSMPPVQAQALAAVLRWGADLEPDERERAVRRLAAVAAWWPTNRDFRHAGLLVHGSPEEAGRPGSLRWPVIDGESEARYFEAADLTTHYAEFLEALADLSAGVTDADPDTWRERSLELRERIASDLWDDDRGAWVDRDTRTGEPSHIVGAHALVPLALGLVDDENRIGRVIDELVLRPDGLWGDEDGPRLPIPEIAYDVGEIPDGSRPSHLEDAVMALRALSRHGRTSEADRLLQRVLAMVGARPEGLYDRYGDGDAPAEPGLESPRLQAGAAGAALLGILHHDHQRERIVFADETRIEGRIAVARFLEGGARLVDLGTAMRLPHLVLESLSEGVPLDERAGWRLTVQPSCDVAVGDVVDVALPALGPFRWAVQDGTAAGRSNGSLSVEVGRSYAIEPLRMRGGGCACRAGASGPTSGGGLAALAVLAAAALWSLGRRRR